MRMPERPGEPVRHAVSRRCIDQHLKRAEIRARLRPWALAMQIFFQRSLQDIPRPTHEFRGEEEIDHLSLIRGHLQQDAGRLRAVHVNDLRDRLHRNAIV
jgi:hypothetical protein